MKKKISIIFILPDLETGGAERIVTTIANHLDREKFEPKILLLRKEGGYLDFLKEDVEIIDIKTPRIRHSLMPILYLDSQYSRFLNALGLYSAAQKSYKLAREKSNETSN